MKNSTKRIIMSVLTLVLTVVALGTTTFAWFSISNISTVSGVNANVQAGDGLEIQLVSGDYESDFKNSLDADDWDAFMEAEAEGFEFAAVTSVDGETFRELAQRHDGGLGLQDLDGANEKYLEFTINFRSLQPGYVNLTTLTFGGGSQEWTPSGITEYLQFAGQTSALPVEAYAKNAARISFTHATTEGETTEVFQEPKLDYSVDDNKITGNHFQGANGVEHGQWDYLKKRGVRVFDDVDVIDGDEITDLPTEPLLYGAISTDAVEQLEEIALSTEVGNYFVGSVTVRIWIEGWDADAYDAIFETTLSVDMAFTKQTSTP